MGFKVVIAKNNLHFSASHFITYDGKCEFLHGHNYAVSVELEGPLTKDSFVFDFVALKKLTRGICESLDHRFLLALQNPHLKIMQVNHHFEVDYKENHYVFPEKDVKPLPVDNITVERLAEYIWCRFAEALPEMGGDHLNTLTVGVEEAVGQAAFYSAALS